jgi:hypothetical protein
MTQASGTKTGERTGGAPRTPDLRADLVSIGERMGFYRTLAESPLTAAELARATGIDEGWAGRWLEDQAAADYLYHDRQSDTYANYCPLPRAA